MSEKGGLYAVKKVGNGCAEKRSGGEMLARIVDKAVFRESYRKNF